MVIIRTYVDSLRIYDLGFVSAFMQTIMMMLKADYRLNAHFKLGLSEKCTQLNDTFSRGYKSLVQFMYHVPCVPAIQFRWLFMIV